MKSLFLLGFSDEEFLAALTMASSEAFFNKLLVVRSSERFIHYLSVLLNQLIRSELDG